MDQPAEAPRIAWGITGSGHFLPECLELAERLGRVDLFLSRAGEEVLQMYDHSLADIRRRMRVFRDTAASAPPVGMFYHGHYRLVVIAPATSNTVAKCVAGISDTLVTNIYAQATKCRVPCVVFACDSEPVMETDAPHGPVMVYPREVDLESTRRLGEFEHTTVVTRREQLESVLEEYGLCPNSSCS